MQLEKYLVDRGLSLEEFARQIGAANGRTVQRYVKHKRVPSPGMLRAIVRETSGAVQPNDFFPEAQ